MYNRFQALKSPSNLSMDSKKQQSIISESSDNQPLSVLAIMEEACADPSILFAINIDEDKETTYGKYQLSWQDMQSVRTSAGKSSEKLYDALNTYYNQISRTLADAVQDLAFALLAANTRDNYQWLVEPHKTKEACAQFHQIWTNLSANYRDTLGAMLVTLEPQKVPLNEILATVFSPAQLLVNDLKESNTIDPDGKAIGLALSAFSQAMKSLPPEYLWLNPAISSPASEPSFLQMLNTLRTTLTSDDSQVQIIRTIKPQRSQSIPLDIHCEEKSFNIDDNTFFGEIPSFDNTNSNPFEYDSDSQTGMANLEISKIDDHSDQKNTSRTPARSLQKLPIGDAPAPATEPELTVSPRPLKQTIKSHITEDEKLISKQVTAYYTLKAQQPDLHKKALDIFKKANITTHDSPALCIAKAFEQYANFSFSLTWHTEANKTVAFQMASVLKNNCNLDNYLACSRYITSYLSLCPNINTKQEGTFSALLKSLVIFAPKKITQLNDIDSIVKLSKLERNIKAKYP